MQLDIQQVVGWLESLPIAVLLDRQNWLFTAWY